MGLLDVFQQRRGAVDDHELPGQISDDELLAWGSTLLQQPHRDAQPSEGRPPRRRPLVADPI